MAGLYDAYQLSNSRAIPQYQGSAIPELTKVSDTLENRYDTGVQQADLLDQSIKTSSASSFDQPLLNQMKGDARQKLQGYADKGNYEDMWRNVAMDARDFATKYKTIAANKEAIATYFSDLNKRVSEGKLDSRVAAGRMKQVQDTYTGLKTDSETGQFTNAFQGAATTPSINYPEKINKWLSESHAIEKGWKAEKDVNGWYVTNGTERKSLPWDDVVDKSGHVVQQGIKKVIDAGVALDPEVRADLAQEHELAPYYNGLSRKMSPEQVQAAMQSSVWGPKIREKINAGLDPVSALHAAVGDAHVTSKVNSIYDYAKKGIVDVNKGEYAEKMDPLTVMEYERKMKEKEKMLFSVPFSDVGPGVKIENSRDFDNVRTTAVQERDAMVAKLGALKNAPNSVAYDKGDKAGQVFRKEPDGSLTDITADANQLRQQIKSADDKVKQYDLIKQSAADAVGYHPEQSSASSRKESEYQAKLYHDQTMESLSVERDMRGHVIPGSYRVPTAQEIADVNKKTEEIRKETLATKHPAYGDYQKELIKRLQPQGEGNNMLVFNDDNMKKTLGDFADGAISNLGLKQGLVSLKIGSGKDVGSDLSADNYDDIKGKIVPLGITNDAKTGETKIVMRALQDIHGKKVKGENILMSMKDVGGIDTYVRTHSSPEEYHKFVMDRTIKSGLNNVAGTMNFPINDRNGASVGNVQITRKKSDTQGPGSFSVRIPTSNGFQQVSADSYEGVIDILNKIQSVHQ